VLLVANAVTTGTFMIDSSRLRALTMMPLSTKHRSFGVLRVRRHSFAEAAAATAASRMYFVLMDLPLRVG